MLQNYIQPSVEFLKIRIDEPVTTATDLILAAICFYAFLGIRRLESTERIKWHFKYYFLILGLGTLFAGIFGHAFQYRMPEEWKLFSWILTLGAVALIAHAMLVAAKPFVNPRLAKVLPGFNILIFIYAIYYTLMSRAFSPVKYFTVYGMLAVVGSLSYFIFLKTRNKGMLTLMYAVVVGFVSAIVFSMGWGLSPWLNHNDISHLILIFSTFNFYKGATLVLSGSWIGP